MAGCLTAVAPALGMVAAVPPAHTQRVLVAAHSADSLVQTVQCYGYSGYSGRRGLYR